MKNGAIVVAIGLVAVSASPACTSVRNAGPSGRAPDQWVRKVSAGAGWRFFRNESEFPGMDEQPVYQVGLDVYRPKDWFGYEAGVSCSGAKDDLHPGSFEAQVGEAYLGLRKTFDLSSLPLSPYLGAGVSATYTQKEFRSTGLPDVDSSDNDFGLYMHVGADWYFHENFFVGVDLRLLREELGDYGGFDLDYDQVTFHLGVSF